MNHKTEFIPTILIRNTYHAARLEYEGFRGIPQFTYGITEFQYPDSPEVRSIIANFDKPQMINLRDFVDHLRRIMDIIRLKKIESGGKNGAQQIYR